MRPFASAMGVAFRIDVPASHEQIMVLIALHEDREARTLAAPRGPLPMQSHTLYCLVSQEAGVALAAGPSHRGELAPESTDAEAREVITGAGLGLAGWLAASIAAGGIGCRAMPCRRGRPCLSSAEPSSSSLRVNDEPRLTFAAPPVRMRVRRSEGRPP